MYRSFTQTSRKVDRRRRPRALVRAQRVGLEAALTLGLRREQRSDLSAGCGSGDARICRDALAVAKLVHVDLERRLSGERAVAEAASVPDQEARQLVGLVLGERARLDETSNDLVRIDVLGGMEDALDLTVITFVIRAIAPCRANPGAVLHPRSGAWRATRLALWCIRRSRASVERKQTLCRGWQRRPTSFARPA